MSGFAFGTSGFGSTSGLLPEAGTVPTKGPRTYFSDFALANPIYGGAQVTIYMVDPVTLTATKELAPLFSDLVSVTELANPQILDGEGKWLQPVYIGGPCIAVVSGASDSAANGSTGIEGVIAGFQGDWVSGTPYFTGNIVRDGANGGDTSGLYYCDTPHLSGVFGNDLAAGFWLIYLAADAIRSDIVSSTLTAAQASAAAALGSETAASTSATASAGSATASAAAQNNAATYSASAGVSAAAAAGSAAAAEAAAAPAGLNNVGRNQIHNSIMRVQQRGVGPFTTSGAFSADRWFSSVAGASTFSTSIITLTDADRSAIGDEEAEFALQIVGTGTGGAGDFIQGVKQSMERVRRLAGKTVMVSFEACVTSGTPKVGLELVQFFGTGGSPSGTVDTIGSQQFTLSTAWTRYISAPIAVPSASGKTLGTNGDGNTRVNFWMSAGATNNSRAGNIGVQSYTLKIRGVQLEVGSIATPLEKPDLAIELANCQRFYRTGTIRVLGSASGAGVLIGHQQSFPAMRAAPTVTPTYGTQTNCTGGITGVDTQGFESFLTATAAGQCVAFGTYTATADL